MSEYSGLSASGIGPAIECPTRMAFPHCRTSNSAARRGNVLHAFCRNVTINPSSRETNLADIADPKIRATASRINLGAALDGLDIVACERSYILNVKTRTVRVAGDNIDRKYDEALAAIGLEPLGKYDVPATIDVVAMALGVPVELDYKSGQNIGPIKDHWQRRICATALMVHYDAPSAISRVAYILENGDIIPDGDEFSCLDIDDFCDEVVRCIDAIDRAKATLSAGKMPDVYPSDSACKYCDAIMFCPYWTNFARALIGELESIEKGPSPLAMTPEQLGKAWSLMKRARKVLDPIEAAGKAIATVDSPLIIDDEHVVAPVWSKGKRYFDDARARGELTKLYQGQGLTEAEISAKLESLMGVGKDYAKYPTTKRKLPTVQ